ncbi:hypothetical protein [Bacillus sp. NPDC077027]
MKVIKWAFLAFSIALFTTGCNHDYGANNASTLELKVFFQRHFSI